MFDKEEAENSKIKMQIGKSLRRFRKNFKQSQGDVAKSLGILQQTYYKNEAGRAIPSASVIFKLAEHYNVSADYLLGLTDNPAPNTAPPAESAGAMSTVKATGDTAPITEERINQLEERLDRYDSWFKRKGIDI